MRYAFLISYDGTHFYGLAVCAGALIVIVVFSRIPLGKVLRAVKGVVFLVIFTAALNILFYNGETVYAEWWVITITKEGLIFSAFLALRLALLVVCSSLLTYTTTPVSLTDGVESLLTPLKWIKVPVHALALVMSIALRFIPILMDETERIKNAQKARGADFESGNIFKRVRAMIPILVPLLLSAFRRADELGDAMDARCYTGGNKRTKYKKLRFGWRDLVAFLVGAALIAGVVLMKIYLPAPY